MIKNQGPMDLPDRQRDNGIPPLTQPEYVNRIAAVWQDEYDAEEGYGRSRSMPEAGPYRGSFASIRCDRQLHYAMTEIDCDNGCTLLDGITTTITDGTTKRVEVEKAFGFEWPERVAAGGINFRLCPKCEGTGKIPLPQSNPPTIADKWRFKTGKWVHAEIEKLVPIAFPDDRSEVVVDLRSIGIPGSAHADQVHYIDGQPADVIEYKTINGFGYKMAATTYNGPPEGPKSGALLQAAMVAAALDADRVVVANLSLENLSPKMATSFADSELGRFAAEWIFDIDGLMPRVDAEVKRINRVLKFQGSGLLPARELHDEPETPKGAIVTDPKRGMWEVHNADGGLISSRTTWMCDYCPHRKTCLKDGAS